jgi:hypothetical protein
MKVETRVKAVTIVLPAKTAADLKRVADFEEAMSRQVGFKFTMEPVVDAQGNESRIVGWPMKRQDQAALAMFLRRGKLATGTAKGKELLKADEVVEKNPATVKRENGLERVKAVNGKA